ncbi:MAG: hypothetical protein J5923_03945 [Acidaminococcaceae bacterium]|nr:hypothetical protein [Acidaminococcaceae bacterium]
MTSYRYVEAIDWVGIQPIVEYDRGLYGNLKPTRFRLFGIERKRLRALQSARLFHFLEDKGMEKSLLYEAASVWKNISQYRYSLTYGQRQKLHTITLSFFPEDFLHLAGFQYLKDLRLPHFTPAKTLQKILDGIITQEQIEKGIYYKTLVEPRLLSLVYFEKALDNDFLLYFYRPDMYPFYTSINANYLIASRRENIDFIFLIRCNIIKSVDNYVCCSTFIKDQKDYEKNQRRCTILKKTKTLVSTSKVSVLYIKDGFKE